MEVYPFLAVPIGFLLGSIPSAYIVGRLIGVDLRSEGQGHVSATAVYRRSGALAFGIVLLMDGGKGALAILIANRLTDSLPLVLATGFLTAVGHCWSFFIKFNGGLGAVVTYSVMLSILPWQFLIGSAAATTVFLITRRSFASTIVWLATISAASAIARDSVVLSLYPLSFILVQVAKRYQMRRAAGGGEYQDELFHDLKKTG